MSVRINSKLSNGGGSGNARVWVNGKLIGLQEVSGSGQVVPFSFSGDIENINAAFVEVLLEAKTSSGTITFAAPQKYSVVVQ